MILAIEFLNVPIFQYISGWFSIEQLIENFLEFI